MADFTPGPWLVNDRVIHSHEIKSSGCELIADVFNFSKDQNAIANANLISAAPDMYEALSELIELVGGILEGNYKPDSFTLQPARFAIAKALGEFDGWDNPRNLE